MNCHAGLHGPNTLRDSEVQIPDDQGFSFVPKGKHSVISNLGFAYSFEGQEPELNSIVALPFHHLPLADGEQ